MNRKTIQKVIDELQKEKPDLSYIRGILETLMETLEAPTGTTYTAPIYVPPYNTVNNTAPNVIYEKVDSTNLADEGAVMDAEAAARMASIKKMADDSISLG